MIQKVIPGAISTCHGGMVEADCGAGGKTASICSNLLHELLRNSSLL